MSKIRRCSVSSKAKPPTLTSNPKNAELALEVARLRILTSKLIEEKTQIIKENRGLTDANIHLKHQVRQMAERQKILTETIGKLTKMRQMDITGDRSFNESFDSGLHTSTNTSVSTVDSCVNTSINWFFENKENHALVDHPRRHVKTYLQCDSVVTPPSMDP